MNPEPMTTTQSREGGISHAYSSNRVFMGSRLGPLARRRNDGVIPRQGALLERACFATAASQPDVAGRIASLKL